MTDIENLRNMANSIYLLVDMPVAKEISDSMKEAANTIEALRATLEDYKV